MAYDTAGAGDCVFHAIAAHVLNIKRSIVQGIVHIPSSDLLLVLQALEPFADETTARSRVTQ